MKQLRYDVYLAGKPRCLVSVGFWPQLVAILGTTTFSEAWTTGPREDAWTTCVAGAGELGGPLKSGAGFSERAPGPTDEVFCLTPLDSPSSIAYNPPRGISP